MKKFLSICLLCLSSFCFAQQVGTIKGSLTDKETQNDPLPFANVIIKRSSKGTTSDFDGNYELKDVEPGTYTLIFSFIGYETRTVPNVKVTANKITTVNTTLGTDADALDEVLISVQTSREKETALLLNQKKAVKIKQSIGAQELARKGVSTVEGAVIKTTGVTKVASRGVFVRGLDERYNYLTVNNLPIAPVNWETKIPSLDLFTSSVISKIDVNKIFYSNLYGDFAGASINIDTKEMPNSGATKISFNAGVNFQSLQNDFLTDKENGKQHYFGFGGSEARATPPALRNENYNSHEIFQAEGAAAVNAFQSDWDTEMINKPISTGFSISNEGVIARKENGNRTSYYVTMGYSNDYDSQIGSSFLKNPLGNTMRRTPRNNEFSFKTKSNALLSLFRKSENNYLNFNYLFLKSTTNSISDNFGRYNEVSANLLGKSSKYLDSYLSQFQLQGKYDLNSFSSIDYAATYGNSAYGQPDNNVVTIEEQSDGSYVFASNSSRLYKYFLDTENDNLAGHLGYNLNMETEKSNDQNIFKLGADFNRETLDVYNRFVLVDLLNTGSIPIDPNNIDSTLDNAFLNGQARYNELVDTRFLDIKTEIMGGNASYNYNFSNKLNVLLGVRLENFNRKLGETSLDNPYEFKRFFVLPNLNMRYSLTDNSNLRLAASKTYTKPKNIEVVNITRQNSLGDLIQGNPDLKNSDNYNIDLKYEIFPDANSLFSANLFGKYINNPIERLVQDSNSFVQTVFENTDEAYLYGAEFELKTTLGFLLNKSRFDNLSFGANVTLMNSEINISENLQQELNLTHRKRRLQGASDFLLNADISYKADFSKNFESQFTFTFNTYSKRISRVGSGAASVKYNDEFEQPFNNLSFIWKNKLYDQLSASVKFQNMLDDRYERTINGFNNEPVSNVSYTLGRSVSLSLSYEF